VIYFSPAVLAQLGQRYPDSAERVVEVLVEALQAPAFAKPDMFSSRPGHDYAFDGLWLLVVGTAPGEESIARRSPF
jgi:hypothetical protein